MRFGAAARVLFGATLAAALTLSFSSAVSNFLASLEFVRGREPTEESPTGWIGQLMEVLPSGTGFGYYAPQVSSEFRVTLELGDPRTGDVRTVALAFGPEASTLVSCFSNMAQDPDPAEAVARSIASYGFTRHPAMDAAQIVLEAEALPPLRGRTRTPSWVVLRRYYFKR